MKMKLSEIAFYVEERVNSDTISLEEYVTTDCILQNKRGRECATNLPPQSCSLVCYKKGDVLVANIRPYLKKIWYADIDGAASSDVLVFRAKDGHSSEFLFATLLQDSFYDYVMQGAKGSKMPRGDKEQIMRYEMPTLSIAEESIGKFIMDINRKIRLNEQINQNLEALAKQLYDYWFVQFDFPNEEGKPYKSSGGKMVWNEKLKRDIPEGWENTTLGDFCEMYQPQTIGTNELVSNGLYRVYGANGIVGRYDKYNHEESEIAMACRGNSCGVLNRTMPYSWITGNAMVIRMRNNDCCNEFIKQALPYMNIAGAITGSGQPQLTRENLSAVSCIKPMKTILQAFSNKVTPIVSFQLQLTLENEELIKQRDELLPLLMNGQVSLNSDLSYG